MAKKTKTVKEPKEQFIVTWDNEGGDPVKVFDDEDTARKFCAALVMRDQKISDEVTGCRPKRGATKWNLHIDVSDVVPSSVTLYKGTLVGKATVTFN